MKTRGVIFILFLVLPWASCCPDGQYQSTFLNDCVACPVNPSSNCAEVDNTDVCLTSCKSEKDEKETVVINEGKISENITQESAGNATTQDGVDNHNNGVIMVLIISLTLTTIVVAVLIISLNYLCKRRKSQSVPTLAASVLVEDGDSPLSLHSHQETHVDQSDDSRSPHENVDASTTFIDETTQRFVDIEQNRNRNVPSLDDNISYQSTHVPPDLNIRKDEERETFIG